MSMQLMFAEMFAGGNRRAAMDKLRTKMHRVTRAQVFFFGLFIGLALPALWNIIRMLIEHPTWEGVLPGMIHFPTIFMGCSIDINCL